jgi:hypothetical protein
MRSRGLQEIVFPDCSAELMIARCCYKRACWYFEGQWARSGVRTLFNFFAVAGRKAQVRFMDSFPGPDSMALSGTIAMGL